MRITKRVFKSAFWFSLAAFCASALAFRGDSFLLFFIFNGIGWMLLFYAVLKSIENND